MIGVSHDASGSCVMSVVITCIVSSFLSVLLTSVFFLTFIFYNYRKGRESSTQSANVEEVEYEQVCDTSLNVHTVDRKREKKIVMKENESYAIIEQ